MGCWGITAFESDATPKESIQWLKEYLSDTLKWARKNAEFQAEQGTKWNGWFKEKSWSGWQKHMTNLISRLDSLLASSKEYIELISSQEQEVLLDQQETGEEPILQQ